MSLLLLFQGGTGPAPGPPGIVTQPEGGHVASGHAFELSVVATGATSYQWYIGASGDTSNAISGATDSTYTAFPTQNTQYWVRVSNAFGDTDSNAALVEVRGGGGGKKKHKKVLSFAEFSTKEEREKALAETFKSNLVIAKGKPLPIEGEPPVQIGTIEAVDQAVQKADSMINVSHETLLELQKRKREEEAILMILLSL